MTTTALAPRRGVARYARMFRSFVSTEFQFEMEYRTNFALGILEMILVIGTSLGAVLVIFGHTQALSGWTLGQMIVLTGVYYVVQGSVNLIFSPSFERLMEHVRLGTLDFTLLKPASAQFLVSVRHMRIVRISDLVMGTVVLGIGLVMVGSTLTLAAAITFALTLAAGVAAVYALLLTLVTLAFWWVRIENLLAIFWAFTDAGRFPVDVYPGWLRFTLSTVVPIGIAVTVPAEALAGRLTGETLAFMIAGTSGSIAFSSWFWRRGLRSYTGASA